MIYLLIGIMIIYLSYIEAIIKSRNFSHVSLISITIILILFAGLRDEVGTDWASYFNFYKYSSKHIQTGRVEIGWAIINNFFSSLSMPYNIFLLFINGLSLTLMCFFFKKNSIFMVIGLLLFFSNLYLYYNLSGHRQALAISITCFSLTYAINRQFGIFALLILIASSFHLTAIVFIVAYFLPRNKLNSRHIIIFAIAFLILTFFLESISDWITLKTIKNANFYLNIHEKSEAILQLYYIGIIARSVIIFIILVFGRAILQNRDSRYIFNLYLFGFAIYLSFYMISPDLGVRISSYFTIVEIILASKLVYFVQRRTKRIAIATIFSIVAVYKLFGYINSDYYTYKSIVELF